MVPPVRPLASDERGEILLLVLILLARLTLGTAYSLVQPPLESHDETGHSAYVAHVADQLALPDPGGELTRYFDEGHQPPLYYVVPGLIGHLLGWHGQYTPPMNPFFLDGDGRRGVNAAVHVLSEESPPWSGPLLLLHAARFWSVLLGALTVWLTWVTGRLALPRQPGVALAGAAIAAFVPTSLAVTDAVTNDALVPVTFGFALIASLLLLRSPSTGKAALLGVAVGLGLLTKNSALVLLPFAFLVVALAWWRHRQSDSPRTTTDHPMRTPQSGCTVLEGGRGARASRPQGSHALFSVTDAVRWLAALYGTVLLVAGWWYLRNKLLFGHWITDRQEASTLINAPGVQGSAVLHSATGSFAGQLVTYTFRSFWVLMGWGTLGAPEGVYRVLLAGTLVCIGGLGWLLVRRGTSPPPPLPGAGRGNPTGIAVAPIEIADPARGGMRATADIAVSQGGSTELARLGPALLVCFFLLMAPEPLYRAIYYESPTLVPGRYLFGALGAAGLLLALGWSAFFVRARWLLALPGLGLAALSIWLLVNVVGPAYAAPAAVPPGTPIPNPVDVIYGGSMHLIGYKIDGATASPGETLHVTLYWQDLRPMSQAYTVGVHVVSQDGKEDFGQVDSFPGRGNLATPLWRPGRIYADDYDVPIRADAPAPQAGRLAVGVQLQELAPLPRDPTHRQTAEVLPSIDSGGKVVTPLIGHFRVGGAVTPDRSALTFRFGDALGLTGIQLPARVTAGRRLAINLRWRALQTPLPSLKVFAHILGPDGKVVAQAPDMPPRAGRYPTDLWLLEESVADTLDMPIPPGLSGRYTIELGVYRDQDQQRLPATSASGQVQPGGRVILGTVDVVGQ